MRMTATEVLARGLALAVGLAVGFFSAEPQRRKRPPAGFMQGLPPAR